MAKTKPAKKDVDPCTIKGTNKRAIVFGCAHRTPTSLPTWRAWRELRPIIVTTLKSVSGGTIGLKNRLVVAANSMEPKSCFCLTAWMCRVHTPSKVRVQGRHWRVHFGPCTVYCKCEMPYNPDDLMVHCEWCKDCYLCLLELEARSYTSSYQRGMASLQSCNFFCTV